MSVHQNHAPLYWKIARARRELHAQVLRLRGGDAYAVFSATPWAQLQSQIGCAEGEDLEDGDREGDEADTLDFLSLMGAYGSVISEFLGLGVDVARSFTSLSLRTIDEADFAGALEGRLDPGELRLIQALIGANERFYLPREQLAYLASPSPNSAAEYAAIHLLRRYARANRFYAGTREDFFRIALESAFGFLGSLILNPRRKCDLPADHARRLAQLQHGAKPAYAGERAAREWTVACFSPGETRERQLARLPSTASRRALPAYVAARALGQMLAKQLHPWLLGLRHGSAEFTDAIELLTRRRGTEDAYGALQTKAAAPAPQRTRRTGASRGPRAEPSKRETL